METIMPKKIKSHKDLSIRWRKETCSYTLDLQPIGGIRQSFDSKAEATIEAKRMFEIFETGKPATETKPWTVEKAVAEYLKHAKNRAEDPDARYGLEAADHPAHPSYEMQCACRRRSRNRQTKRR